MATTATGSRHSLDYIAESTYGSTPATPAFSDLRITGTTLGLEKTAVETQEIRDDRQIEHSIHGTEIVNGEISVELSDGTFDDLIEAALGGTWATNVVKAGTTRRSFTFERKFGNMATPEYHRSVGAEINSMSVSIPTDGIVTATFGVIGQSFSKGTSIISGATYGARTTSKPFDSFQGSINEGGSAIGIVTSLEFTLENGLNPMYVIGSEQTLQPGIGKSRVTGTVSMYFQDSTYLDKFINDTASSLDVTLSDGTNTLKFDFPNIRYNGGKPDVSGEGEITLSMPFIALYDTTDASNIVITRG